MRVSIISPSKNQGRYIDHCMRSVHGQTHRDIEHIVLDGMSTDETMDIAAKYPCTFLQRKDSGPAQAINRGLEMATGEIVCWLNTDDVFWSKKTLERVVQLFLELPEVDMITGNGYYINEDGEYIHPVILDRPARFRFKWIKRRDFILQPATFWRRNDLRLDESKNYCFDWKLWIDCFSAGHNIIYVPEYFAMHRSHPISLTQQDTASRKGEIYSLLKEYNRDWALICWAWAQWRTYQLSESLRLPVLKQLVGLAAKVVSTLSDGLI